MNTSQASSRMTQPFPDSLWVETAAGADSNPPLEGDVSADVVVTGAGYTGLRAALELAEAGSRVRVLEAADVGWGASGRNGGQVNPMLPFNAPDQLRKLLGVNCFERITDGLLKGLSGNVIPLLPIQIATDPLAEDQIATILPGRHTLSDTRRIIMYARREPDNRMVFGGLGRYSPNGEIGGFDWLERDATRIFPCLKGVHWRFRWGGQIALTADHLPQRELVNPVAVRLWRAGGGMTEKDAE